MAAVTAARPKNIAIQLAQPYDACCGLTMPSGVYQHSRQRLHFRELDCLQGLDCTCSRPHFLQADRTFGGLIQKLRKNKDCPAKPGNPHPFFGQSTPFRAICTPL